MTGCCPLIAQPHGCPNWDRTGLNEQVRPTTKRLRHGEQPDGSWQSWIQPTVTSGCGRTRPAPRDREPRANCSRRSPRPHGTTRRSGNQHHRATAWSSNKTGVGVRGRELVYWGFCAVMGQIVLWATIGSSFGPMPATCRARCGSSARCRRANSRTGFRSSGRDPGPRPCSALPRWLPAGQGAAMT